MDLFSGTGSFLVAAIELMRQAIGFEIDTAIHDIAMKRLIAQVLACRLPIPLLDQQVGANLSRLRSGVRESKNLMEKLTILPSKKISKIVFLYIT